MAAKPDPQATTAIVWDLPIRLFHWSLVALLPALWWTAENGQMVWHMRLGTGLLGLLLFRLLWGLVGSATARFATFVAGPRAVLAYLRGGQDSPQIGHSPLAALSVLAMLALLLLQVGLGLVAGDPDDGATGPLNPLVSYATALSATQWHETLFNVIVALVVLHVVAVVFYLTVRRNNLITPMITGRNMLPEATAPLFLAPPGRALLCALVAAALALWLGNGASLMST